MLVCWWRGGAGGGSWFVWRRVDTEWWPDESWSLTGEGVGTLGNTHQVLPPSVNARRQRGERAVVEERNGSWRNGRIEEWRDLGTINVGM